MRAKAIKDLSQFPDNKVFETIAEGLGYILDNAQRLYADSEDLADHNRFHGSRILRYIAEEEAAKFLILLDAIRCPREPDQRWSKHLKRFNDHLAKGLYSQSCYWRPATFGQLQKYLDNERTEFYLDGPNGVDWIFRNDILQRREETLYVDYVETEEDHFWLHPARYGNESDFPLKGVFPETIKISQALFDCGATSVLGLKTVAGIWRKASIGKGLEWPKLRELNSQTLEELKKKHFLKRQPSESYAYVMDKWQFPMYDLDLSPIRAERADLRERQRNWLPDY